jgi:hypothetical protein
MSRLGYILRGSPKFCSSCGQKLVELVEPYSFNKHTGKVSVERVSMRCPDVRWTQDGITILWTKNEHDYYPWFRKAGGTE